MLPHSPVRSHARKRPRANHGFAIPLKPDTQLGLAMLIAEDEEGHYQPIAVASTIDEAKELATSDLRGRMRDLECGGAPMCPYEYKLWAQGVDGDYLLAATFPATSL